MNRPFSSLTGDINKWNNELVSAQTISPTLQVFFVLSFFYENRSHNIKVLIHYFKTFFFNNILVFFIISMQAVSFRMIRFIFIFFQINPSHDRLEVFVRLCYTQVPKQFLFWSHSGSFLQIYVRRHGSGFLWLLSFLKDIYKS